YVRRRYSVLIRHRGSVSPVDDRYDLNMSTRNHALSPAISAAMAHAVHLTSGRLTNSPICLRLLVKMTSGTTAKLNCNERITWLRISSFSVPRAPFSHTTMIVGTIASPRVISRRSQGE